MQMLFDGSDESPDVAGLGVVAGPRHPPARRRCGCRRWAGTRSSRGPAPRSSPGLPDPAWCYFVHTFAPDPTDDARRRRVVRVRPPVRGRDRARARCGRRSSTPRRAATVGLRCSANFVDAVATRESRMMDLYPSIDLRDGRSCGCCSGDYDARDASTTTIRSRSRAGFDAAGARWIHVVDLDAARRRRRREPRRDRGDLRQRVACKVQTRRRRARPSRTRANASRRASTRVVIGSAAVEHPELVDELARDASRARSRSGSTRAAATSRSTAGPTRPGSTSSGSRERFDRSRASARSSSPSIDRDGMLAGPDVDQLAAVLGAVDRAASSRAAASHRSTTCARSPRSTSTAGGSRARSSGRAIYEGPLHRRGGDRRVLAVRVIPCLDVDAGRVVKGVRFVEHPRRRRSGRARGALRRRRRRRARVPRHHRVVRRPRHDGARRRAGRRAGVHPVHRRRRDPHASKTSAACCAPAPTRSRSTPRRSNDPEIVARRRRRVRRRSASSSRSTPAAATPTTRRGLGGRDARRAHADRARRGRVGGARVRPRRGRDPAHVDGPRRHQGRLRHRAPAGGRRRGERPGDRERRRRHARAPVRRASRRAARPAVLAASIFHFGQHSGPRGEGATWPTRGSPSGPNRDSAVRDQRRRTTGTVSARAAGAGYRDRTSAGARAGPERGGADARDTLPSERRNGKLRVDDHFFRRYRELLDDEDHAFDELEHAYEDGDRAHFELDLAAWRSAFERRMTFLERARRRRSAPLAV